MVASCITYFIVIFGGRYLMQNLPAQRLQFFFQIHNLLLTLVSGALLVLMVENIFPILYHKGLLHAVCDTDAWTQPLELLYYLNYLVKYWELIDTVFLVLKKKKLGKLKRKAGTLGGNTRDSVAWILIIITLS